MKWRLNDIKKLLLELLYLTIGTPIFLLLFIVGILYTFIKHLFFKFDYSITKQLNPILRSITLIIDCLANAGAGELLNDLFKVDKLSEIRYGYWNQTISAVSGILIKFKNKDTWLRKSLEVLGKDHCVNAITKQDDFYYKNHIKK